MSELSVFAYESSAVRTTTLNGEPWFVATDIAKILGYKLATDMLKMLDEDEKGMQIVHTLGGDQELSVISESGLYAAILKSRRPEAKAFRKWVTAEILPSIRKTGGYTATPHSAPEQLTTFPAHQADRLVAADRTFRAFKRSALAIGMDESTAVSRARDAAKRMTGIDVLDGLGVAYEATLKPEEAMRHFLKDFDVTPYMDEEKGLPDIEMVFYSAYLPWCRDKGVKPVSYDRLDYDLRRKPH